MIVGSVFFPEVGRARGQQVLADLLTAVSLDHQIGHEMSECDVCLAVGWGLLASAAQVISGEGPGFCSTLLTILGAEGVPSPAEAEKFREIGGPGEPQESPTDKG